MYPLSNPIQNYAWGSRKALAELFGRPPASKPEAELWIGAHPRAPSGLPDGRNLMEAIGRDTVGMLGPDVASRFGRLPFLLKVLAVDSPLSLQAHPNLAQAREGFLREQAAGIALHAAERTYKDDNHKPELLCALTPFEALSGFRPPKQTAQLLQSLGVTALDLSTRLGTSDGGELERLFSDLMQLEGDERERVVTDVVGRCRRARDAGAAATASWSSSIDWAVRLAEHYPGDVGAVASLLLNHLELAPLEAVYLEAGRLHSYLSGVGVEVMANSDNVLRGGLTPKHVDVGELSRVLRFDASEATPLRAARGLPGEMAYVTPAAEFALSRIDLGAGNRFEAEVRGPEILLCVEGEGRVASPARGDAPVEKRALGLPRGAACFVPHSDGSYALTGTGRFFRATVGASDAPKA